MRRTKTGQRNIPYKGIQLKQTNMSKSHLFMIMRKKNTIWRGDFIPKLTLNHPSLID
jgi:hypothetical protein